MKNLISAEALRLRTLALPRLVLALAALGSAFIGFAIVHIAHHGHTVVTSSDLMSAPAQPLWFLAVVAAVLATAGEFQHRSICTSLLQTPRRGRLLTAKAIVAAGYGAAVTFVGTIAAALVGVLTAHAEHVPLGSLGAHLWLPLLGTVTIGALWGVLAAGLGMLVRNSAVALVAVLLWKFVVEGLLPILPHASHTSRWLPGGSANAVLHGGPTLLQPWAGGLLFAAYVALIMLVGTLRFTRSEP